MSFNGFNKKISFYIKVFIVVINNLIIENEK